MLPSMRISTLINKRRNARDDMRLEQRKVALNLLRSGISQYEASRASDVSRAKIHRLQEALKSDEKEKLSKKLSPQVNRAGHQAVLTAENDLMINQRIDHPASRGFALDKPMLT